jgi:peroxiredoxin
VIAIAEAKMTPATPVRYNQFRRQKVLRGEIMQVNDKAPNIHTTDENGKEVALKDFQGKTVVLFFYPKADTPG